MELSRAERSILARFAERCRTAGGARPGYVLRRGAFRWLETSVPGLDLEGGLATLVERGLLKVNEEGDLFFLTEEGVANLGGG